MIITKQMTSAVPVDQKDLWGTPQPIYDKLNSEFAFLLDPCATDETKKCYYHFTPKENGLIQSWAGKHVYCNPPYSRGNIDKWVKKCSDESRRAFVVALLPVSTSADWYQDYICGKHEVRFVNKRIKFQNAPGTAPFSSMIVLFNNNPIHVRWDQPLIK